MSVHADVLAPLMRDEGWRPKPYRCTAGALTIGFGTNLDAGISEDEGLFLLENRVSKVILALKDALPWFDALDAVRQGVLVQMAYQMGVEGLLKFRRTLAAVERGDFATAADYMLQSLWAKQTPARALRLSQQMRFGKVLNR